MNVPIYHTGIRAQGRTAVFEYRRNIDFLSCELLAYTGRRQTTKKAARERAKANKVAALAQLNKDFPGRNFNRIVID